MRVYTIGSSTRTKEEFLELLKAHGIKCLIDVRSFPTSRFEHFKQENLKQFLNKNGIRYVYMGKELGGYRKGGYEAYMQTEEYKKGIEILEKIIKKEVVVVMCAEKFPWRCHRRFIARTLKERGIEVIHLIEKNKSYSVLL